MSLKFVALKFVVSFILISTLLLAGCADERAVQLAREAADRQAAQNHEIARVVDQSQQRMREVAALHRGLQAERGALQENWDALEHERKQIAQSRRTESFLKAIFHGSGIVLMSLASMALCFLLIFGLRREETGSAELTELLLVDEATQSLLGGSDASLLESDLEGFHAKIRSAYVACHQAVQDELARHRHSNGQHIDHHIDQHIDQQNNHSDRDVPSPPDNGRKYETGPAVNRIAGGAGGASGHSGGDSARCITGKQLTYARQLANQIKTLGSGGLDNIARQCFGKQPEELTSFQGSQLIDQLKAIKSGDVTMPDALMGAAS